MLLSDIVKNSFVLWVGAYGQGLGGTRPFSLCVSRSARYLASLDSGFARARSARPLLGGVRYPYFETIGNASNSNNLLPIFLTQVSPIFCIIDGPDLRHVDYFCGVGLYRFTPGGLLRAGHGARPYVLGIGSGLPGLRGRGLWASAGVAGSSRAAERAYRAPRRSDPAPRPYQLFYVREGLSVVLLQSAASAFEGNPCLASTWAIVPADLRLLPDDLVIVRYPATLLVMRG